MFPQLTHSQMSLECFQGARLGVQAGRGWGGGDRREQDRRGACPWRARSKLEEINKTKQTGSLISQYTTCTWDRAVWKVPSKECVWGGGRRVGEGARGEGKAFQGWKYHVQRPWGRKPSSPQCRMDFWPPYSRIYPAGIFTGYLLWDSHPTSLSEGQRCAACGARFHFLSAQSRMPDAPCSWLVV